MKSLTEQIASQINEAKNIEYTVSLIDVRDSEGLNATAYIAIDRKYQKQFEKWLEDEQDNLFAHAEGGNVEY